MWPRLMCFVYLFALGATASGESEVERAFQRLFATAPAIENPGADFITKMVVAQPSEQTQSSSIPTPRSETSPVPNSVISKVPVEVYYEALCPYCQAFMGGALTEVLRRTDVVNIIDLKLVPYGNTHVDEEGTFHCQHGVGECMSDVIMQCTLYKLGGSVSSIGDGSQSAAAWPFIRQLVVEEKGHPVKAEESYEQTLGKSSTVTWATVIDCYKNEANIVQKAAAEATPSHQYTAWIVVNHEHLEDGNALLHSICEAYKGVKPQSCAAAMSLSLIKDTRKSVGIWGSSFVWTDEEKRQSALSERMAENKNYNKRK